MTQPLVIAHRGGARLWPENTLTAFTHAAKAGFDGAELDVQLTRDGKLAVFHDFRVGRALWRQTALPGKSRAVAKLDFAALAPIEIPPPRRKMPIATDAIARRIPLLSDVVRAVRAIRGDFMLLVEIKTALAPGLSAPPETAAAAVVAAIDANSAWDSVILVGFDWRALIRAKHLQPRARCWFSSAPVQRHGDARASGFHRRGAGSYADAIAAAGGDGWFAHAGQATPAAVARAHGLGLKTGVWTVNAKHRLQAQIARGVDAICTDRPDILAAILAAQRPSNSAVDR